MTVNKLLLLLTVVSCASGELKTVTLEPCERVHSFVPTASTVGFPFVVTEVVSPTEESLLFSRSVAPHAYFVHDVTHDDVLMIVEPGCLPVKGVR